MSQKMAGFVLASMADPQVIGQESRHSSSCIKSWKD